MLALVSSVAKGEVSFVGLATTAAVAMGFTILVAKWGTRTMDRIVPHMEERLRLGEGTFALSMVLLFALSVLSVYAGVAAIIGAFLAGTALAESVGRRVPFFLAGIGLHFDLRAFTDRSTLLLALVILAAALLSKFAGCGAGALGLGRRDATRIGIGMMPRGEVGMVVAQIGLSLGVITQSIYAVVVFMAVATTCYSILLPCVGYGSALGLPVYSGVRAACV